MKCFNGFILLNPDGGLMRNGHGKYEIYPELTSDFDKFMAGGTTDCKLKEVHPCVSS
mgnify:FL=1